MQALPGGRESAVGRRQHRVPRALPATETLNPSSETLPSSMHVCVLTHTFNFQFKKHLGNSILYFEFFSLKMKQQGAVLEYKQINNERDSHRVAKSPWSPSDLREYEKVCTLKVLRVYLVAKFRRNRVYIQSSDQRSLEKSKYSQISKFRYNKQVNQVPELCFGLFQKIWAVTFTNFSP